jgi:predicted ATPase
MVKIDTLSIRNFKSIESLDEFELRPLNILIGPNGSGKSNFVTFFRLLKRAANGRLADFVNNEIGGIDEVRYKGATNKQTIDWQLKLTALETISDSHIYYKARLGNRGNRFIFRSEEVQREPKEGYTEGFNLLGAYDGYIRHLSSVGNDENGNDEYDSGFEYNGEESAFEYARNPKRYPTVDEVRRFLGDFAILRGFGENSLDNIHRSQPISVINPLRVDADGKNLVSVLYKLMQDTEYDGVKEELENTLKIAFADFRRLAFPPVASNKVELQWVNRWGFPARSISDGMLRFLVLATQLLLPDPPPVILIDEPEIGLHPRLIPLLAELLKSASEQSQVIITTHSPQLLSAEAIELSDVVLVHNDDGKTVLERPDEQRLDRWLERYTLGGLWTMGKLGV